MKLSSLVEAHGGTLLGPTDPEITRLVPLDVSDPRGLGFLLDPRYTRAAHTFEGGALVVSTRLELALPQWLHDDPRALRRELATHFRAHAPTTWEGLSERAEISPRARIAATARVAPMACIADDVEIGEDCTIGPHAVLEPGVRLGPRCVIGAHTYIGPGCVLEADVVLGPGCVVGSPGFGLEAGDSGLVRIPHIGGVEIGAGASLGARVCVDAGTLEPTRIGAQTHIDNLVHIAHNVSIGARCLILAQVGIAGSAVIEDDCVIAGQSGVAGHVRVGRGSRIAGRSGVTGNVRPESTLGGFPAFDMRVWRRAALRFRDLEDLYRRIALIEASLRDTEQE